MMLYSFEESTAGRSVDRRFEPRRASIHDDLVIEALQPLDILQIGCRGEVLDGDYGTAAVRRTGSLQEAVSVIAQHEFDAIVLGSGIADAWPTAAYEQIADLAGRTPIVVQTEHVGADGKRQETPRSGTGRHRVDHKGLPAGAFDLGSHPTKPRACRRPRCANRVTTAPPQPPGGAAARRLTCRPPTNLIGPWPRRACRRAFAILAANEARSLAWEVPTHFARPHGHAPEPVTLQCGLGGGISFRQRAAG